MVDIMIVSYQQEKWVTLWVDYVCKIFVEVRKRADKKPYRVIRVGLEDLSCSTSLPRPLEERLVNVHLQIVMLCPKFLDEISEQPNTRSVLGRVLQPDRVLALHLNIQDSSITDLHREALKSYDQWQCLKAENNKTFVGELLSKALKIMNTVAKEEEALDKASFTVLPKKVKQSHNKVIILLNEAMTKADNFKVTVNKGGEILEVVAKRKRNDYTLQFTMPDKCMEVSMFVGVRVEMNGEPLGSRQVKCESRMRELDQLLRDTGNPLDFMCHTMGFSKDDHEKLDTFLLNNFQRNIPTHFHLLQPLSGISSKSPPYLEENPSLLHFAARFGLEKLAWQLMECPGSEQAFELKNSSGLTPHDLALEAGHTKLAGALKGYIEMNEFSNMYCYLKRAAEKSKSPFPTEECEYQQPRPINTTYQVPPPARPLPSPLEEDSGGYLSMVANAGSLKRNGHRERNIVVNPVYEQDGARMFLNVRGTLPSPSSSPTRLTSDPTRSPDEEANKSLTERRKNSKENVSMTNQGIQDELVEIISDFKNNVFTISEVEKLVENWKNRNDVQQSFKEKQDQLNAMREQYECLQQKMKTDMKRSTPFERIRKFFKGGKSKESSKENLDTTNEGLAGPSSTLGQSLMEATGQRPASSLSVASSYSTSSSERMSTISNFSMGDSGTHSDPDDNKTLVEGSSDRKISAYDVLPPGQSRVVNGGGGVRRYETVPEPRPVFEASKAKALKIEERPPLPNPRPDPVGDGESDAYYITPQCIPGRGMPSIAESASVLDPTSPDYINIAPPTLPNYMNVKEEIISPPVPPRRK